MLDQVSGRSSACGLDLALGASLDHRGMTELERCATHIREQAASYCESSKVPGFVAGVYHGGATTVVAHGRGQQRHGRADARQQRGIVTRLPFDAHVEYAIYVLAHW